MNIAQCFSGVIRAELVSADIPAALKRLADADITVFDMEAREELCIRFSMKRKDFTKAEALCENKGDVLRKLRKLGLYWTIRSNLKRPLLVFGMLFLLCAGCYLPGRVLFIEVEGNVTIPARMILSAAENCGICFGASRRAVRSERIKNALLEAVPELQWAGVNTYGCVARISVRERSVEEDRNMPSGFGSIVALHDGVITSCTATRGNLLCTTGQAVKKGEVLVSAYTDCGICIRLEQAEGEIFADTRREMTSVLPVRYTNRLSIAEEKQKISLLIGKKRINLWKDSGIYDVTCGRMYKEYYMTLPGGFRLPVALAVETYRTWNVCSDEISQAEAEALLAGQTRQLLCQQMIAGTIHSENTMVHSNDGICTLEGEYVCNEMIASMQQERIGEK